MESTDHMMATKSNMLELKQEVRQETNREIKQEVENFRVEVKQNIAQIRTEFNIKFVRVEFLQKLHSWMLGFMLIGVVTLILKAFFA